MIYGRDAIVVNPEEVHEQLSLKILYLLDKCCSEQSYLSQETPFLFLTALFGEPMHTSSEHMSILISLLCSIISPQKECLPLPETSIKSLCGILL